MDQYHERLMHQASQHTEYRPPGQCEHCDDARAGDTLRLLYDLKYTNKGRALASEIDHGLQNIVNSD